MCMEDSVDEKCAVQGLFRRISTASVKYGGSLLNTLVTFSITKSLGIINPCGPNGTSSSTDQDEDGNNSLHNICTEEESEDEILGKTLRMFLDSPDSDLCLKIIKPDLNSFRVYRNQGVSIIAHCRQLENWDCGIACIIMIQRWLNDFTGTHCHSTENVMHDTGAKYGHSEDLTENVMHDTGAKYGHSEDLTIDEIACREWMMNELGTSSVWTIDLVILLNNLITKYYDTAEKRKPSFLFCSRNLSVDQSYFQFTYYKDSFESDTSRVINRFKIAEKLNLPTLSVPQGIRLNHVLDVISNRNCVAIALLDNNILMDPDRIFISEKNTATNETQSESKLPVEEVLKKLDSEVVCREIIESQQLYTGHYIVVCGISIDPIDVAEAKKKVKQQQHCSECSFCLVIKNPGISKCVDFVTPDHFEQAWRASGTDQDMIFIRKKS